MGSAKVQGELWGLAAERWAEQQAQTGRPLWSDVLAALRLERGSTLLDAGCGSGEASVAAAAQGCKVTGADASAAMIAIAKRRAPSGRFDVCDLEALPYRDGSFDAVMAINSIFYCEDPAAGMKELRRVVRPGGGVAITAWATPEECDMRVIFAAVAGAVGGPPRPGGPFSLSAPGALDGMLSAAGLKPESSGRTQCPFEYPNVASAWSAQSSSGPVQNAIRAVGEDKVRAAFESAAKPLARDGRIKFRNVFLWSVGRRA